MMIVSRKYKKAWYLLIVLLIIGLMIYETGYYSIYSKAKFSVRSYLENPQQYGGNKYENFGRIINISQNYFYFDLGGEKIKVLGKGIQKPILGETVLYLDYRKDGTIAMIDYHNYNYNYVLYAISALAVIIFIFLFFKEWKITRKGFKNA